MINPDITSSKAEIYESNLCIFGGTPAGITAAIRAAREGLSIVLVSYYHHLGGMLSNGIGVWDTLYQKPRSPIYDEIKTAVFEYYKTTYGEDSEEYRLALPGSYDFANGCFEPKVIKNIITNLLYEEKNIRILTGYYPTDACFSDGSIVSMSFEDRDGEFVFTCKSKFYMDCSYEGDVLPVVKAPYRLGRESKDEYGEPHAGRLFMRNLNKNEYNKGLDIKHIGINQSVIYPDSSGISDNKIQAFNIRPILTRNPDNRAIIEKPHNYDPEEVKQLEYNYYTEIPNDKIYWNRPQLVNIQHQYIEGGWTVREEIYEAHKKALVSKLYFLQNDESVSKDVRDFWRAYGLPKDEFTDNGNLPYEIYVREGRRLFGEYVIREFDLMLEAGVERSPVKYDGIAFTDWYLDSHPCSDERVRDSVQEGKFMLFYDTYPGHIPLSATYTREIRNFFSPVCLSCTHVAWGAIRLEPTWMHIAESIAYATKLLVDEGGDIHDIDIDKLQIKLIKSKIMISFVNNFEMFGAGSLANAVQYFFCKGAFDSYEIDPNVVARYSEVVKWMEIASKIVHKRLEIASLPGFQPSEEITGVTLNKLLERYGFDLLLPDSNTLVRKSDVLIHLFEQVELNVRNRQNFNS